MLLPLLIAASVVAQSDTIPIPPVMLLGEVVSAPAYDAGNDASPAAEGATETGLIDFTRYGPPAPPAPPPEPEEPTPEPRLSFSTYASMPLPNSGPPGLPIHLVEAPSDIGFSRAQLDEAVAAVEEEVRRGAFPGAALAVGRWDRTVLERGIGTLDRLPRSPAVDPDYTIYDLASLTKVIATTTAVMLLVEDGKLDLDAPVARYLPAFSGGEKNRVTIRHLLTHSSGLPAGGNTSGDTPAESLARAVTMQLATAPGRRVVYSDIGFIVLWAAAEAANEGPLPDLLQARVFEPLEMWFTSFQPGDRCVRCAPTLDRPGYQGVVHDPIARQLGGIAGHAGLFSTAHDLSRFAAMLANGGELAGVRVLERSTIEMFTRRQPGVGTRALGWDTPDVRGNGAAGLRISSTAFGHTGFTGTSLWVDPTRGTWVILLSNRTLTPSGPNRIQQLRRELNDQVASSIDVAR
jgi:CubicO group peptidase (beta-lactamase class C family)